MKYDEFTESQKTVFDNYPLPSCTILHRILDLFKYYSKVVSINNAGKSIAEICRRFELKHKYVLDIGSYNGYNSFYFHCLGNSVSAIEISNKYEYALNRYKNYMIRFLKGDALEIMKKEESGFFDFIFCSNFTGHFDTGSFVTSRYTEELIRTSLKLLNDNGIFYYKFFLVSNYKSNNPVTKEDICKKMKSMHIVFEVADDDFYHHPMSELIIRKEKNRLI